MIMMVTNAKPSFITLQISIRTTDGGACFPSFHGPIRTYSGATSKAPFPHKLLHRHGGPRRGRRFPPPCTSGIIQVLHIAKIHENYLENNGCDDGTILPGRAADGLKYHLLSVPWFSHIASRPGMTNNMPQNVLTAECVKFLRGFPSFLREGVVKGAIRIKRSSYSSDYV